MTLVTKRRKRCLADYIRDIEYCLAADGWNAALDVIAAARLDESFPKDLIDVLYAPLDAYYALNIACEEYGDF